MDAYDAAIRYAAELGADHGRNAAGWYVQDTIGGRSSGDPVRAARYILRGIDGGDSAVTDGFPFANLSGEWADRLTGADLVQDALHAATTGPDAADDDPPADAAESWLSDVCHAYEAAFSAAVSAEIERAARAILA